MERTFYLEAGRTHGNTRGYLQEVLGQSGFSRDRPKLKIFVKRPDCLRKNGFFQLARRSNPMKPPAKTMKQTRPGKRKSKSMPDQEKSKKKGPYGPFFLSPHAIHLSNIESDFPT
jgi:hypothetical protein